MADFVTAIPSSNDYRNGYTGEIGYSFIVGSAALTVTHLARYSVPGFASGTHTLKLYNSDFSTTLASASVDASQASNDFVFVALSSPVTLAANTTYVIASAEVSNGDKWVNNAAISTTSAATIYASEVGNSFPNGIDGTGYGPLSFRYTTETTPPGPTPGNLPVVILPTTGQSLSIGIQGEPALTTSEATDSLFMPGQGLISPNTVTTLVKIRESGAETFHSAMLRQLRAMAAGDTTAYATVGMGVGSAPVSTLNSGTGPFNALVARTGAIWDIAPTYETGSRSVPLIPVVHGESDGTSTTYAADLLKWQLDLRNAINAENGTSGEIPFLCSQPSAWTSIGNLNSTTARSPYAITQAAKENPSRILVVGAKYQYPHVTDIGVHLNNTGYRQLGEMYGKAIYKFLNGGYSGALRPTSVSRNGAVITVTMAGGIGNLALDTSVVSNPGNFGFEWYQVGGTARTISSVSVSGSSTVVITLSGDPGNPSTERLRYAYTGTAGNSGGPTTGPRGCLRDSDTVTGVLSGVTLRNYAVHFDEPSIPAAGVAVGNVRLGIDNGAGSTGTLVLPPVDQVKAGTQYGANGTEFTGTYEDAPSTGGFPQRVGPFPRYN